MRSKNEYGLGSFDRILIAFSSVMAGVLGYMLLNEQVILDLFLPKKEGTVTVGSISKIQNDVRRKLQKSLIWYKAKDDENVFEGDTLFSGESSELTVFLDTGVNIRLGANSLVVLKKQDKELLLDLQAGQISAESNTENKIALVQGGQKANIKFSKGSKVKLRKSNSGSLKVSSSKGKVELSAVGKNQELNDELGVTIDRNMDLKSKKFEIKLENPLDNITLWKSFLERTSFSWSAKGKAINNFKIELSTDVDFEEVILSKDVNGFETSIEELPKDKMLYWRILSNSSSSAEIMESKVRSLTVRSTKPVELIYPLNESTLIPEDSEGLLVALEWKKRSLDTNYLIQVSSVESFENAYIEEPTTQNYYPFQGELGTYFWRVKILASKVNLGWSEVRQFTVSNSVLVPVDEPVMEELLVEEPVVEETVVEEAALKETKTKLASFAMKRSQKVHQLKFKNIKNIRDIASVKEGMINPPKLKWPSVKEAKSYKVQISPGKKFKTEVINKIVPRNFFNWSPEEGGMHYWRIRALGERNKPISKWSKVNSLDVHLPAVALPKSYKSKVKVSEPRKLKSLLGHRLKWNSVPLAAGYLTEVARNSDFDTSKKFISRGSKAILKLKEGQYYFRTYVIDSQKRKISSASNTVQGKLESRLKMQSPNLTFPDDSMSIVTFGKVFEPMLFGWDKVKYAKKYRLQLSSTKKFKKILFESETNENNMLLNKKVGKGEIFWRVRAEFDKKSKSKWSAPRSFEY